jgi:general secretion pathway protein A
MYLKAFGLQRNPFGMTPDPSMLFLTEQHREALTGLTYAILGRKGFVALVGEAGTGKTILLTRALQFLPADRIQSSVILNPALTPDEFLEMTLLDFGLDAGAASKPQRLRKLQDFLLQGREAGKISVLIIDEAHKLSHEVLEEVRLLGNFEDRESKLLQIVLIGQSELNDILNRENLRQLKQRIAVRLKIQPLSGEDGSRYIEHRWTRAGGTIPLPFGREAMSRITAYSRGIPRIVNVICDNSLMNAFGRGSTRVLERDVDETARDFDLIEMVAATPPVSVNVPVSVSPVPLTVEPVTTQALKIPRFSEYGEISEKDSFWTKWAGRLGLA